MRRPKRTKPPRSEIGATRRSPWLRQRSHLHPLLPFRDPPSTQAAASSNGGPCATAAARCHAARVASCGSPAVSLPLRAATMVILAAARVGRPLSLRRSSRARFSLRPAWPTRAACEQGSIATVPAPLDRYGGACRSQPDYRAGVARYAQDDDCRVGTQTARRALALCHDWRDIGRRHPAPGRLGLREEHLLAYPALLLAFRRDCRLTIRGGGNRPLGDSAFEISILYTNPTTQATYLVIRRPGNQHLPRHWHSSNE